MVIPNNFLVSPALSAVENLSTIDVDNQPWSVDGQDDRRKNRNYGIREENEKLRTFAHLQKVVHNFTRFIHASQQHSVSGCSGK